MEAPGHVSVEADPEVEASEAVRPPDGTSFAKTDGEAEAWLIYETFNVIGTYFVNRQFGVHARGYHALFTQIRWSSRRGA